MRFQTIGNQFIKHLFIFYTENTSPNIMNTIYNIRQAKLDDRNQIRSLIRESVARQKTCPDPALIQADFIEEAVDKVIAKGNMLVVENNHLEIEMIGEVHDYFLYTNSYNGFKEFSFISKRESFSGIGETALVTWLFSEIQDKYKDVFRVEISAPVRLSSTVEHYKAMGLTVEGNYNGRLKEGSSVRCPVVPLSWINPAFS